MTIAHAVSLSYLAIEVHIYTLWQKFPQGTSNENQEHEKVDLLSAEPPSRYTKDIFGVR